MIAADSIAFLPRGVRCHYDKVRDTEVLLGPERVLMLDGVGKAILERLDGERTLQDVSAALAQDYAAPLDVITPDVTAFVADLVDKGFVHVR